MKNFDLSQRRSCGLVDVSRTVFRYQPKWSVLNEKVRKRMRELAGAHKRMGLWQMVRIIRREEGAVNHKRIERLYRLEKLALSIRRRKKLNSVVRIELPVPNKKNERWSMDFVQDKLWNGRRFRCLNIVDMFTRQCLAIEVDTSIGGMRVKRVLERLVQDHGKPETITVDNGPEFISQHVDEWAYRTDVKLAFIRPGKPIENAYVESFNGKFRDKCLNTHYFSTLQEAREKINNWREEYNTFIPHRSLKGLTPQEFAAQNSTEKLSLQVA
jgi:putative transposase